MQPPDSSHPHTAHLWNFKLREHIFLHHYFLQLSPGLEQTLSPTGLFHFHGPVATFAKGRQSCQGRRRGGEGRGERGGDARSHLRVSSSALCSGPVFEV